MRRVFATLVAVAVLACGSSGGPSSSGETFLAFGATFAGYEGWEKFDLAGPESPEDGGIPIANGCAIGHDTSTHRVGFLNKRPPAGSSEFPVGTIIVKEMQKPSTPESGWQVFAMVKRGGGYNTAGAKNWEWFEIKKDPKLPTIVWRGIGPPTGEGYGSPACGGCNGCHGAAAKNDYVASPALSLEKL